MGGNFAGFTSKYGEDGTNLMFLWNIGCCQLIQDWAKTVSERFIFLSGRAIVDREQVRKD